MSIISWHIFKKSNLSLSFSTLPNYESVVQQQHIHAFQRILSQLSFTHVLQLSSSLPHTPTTAAEKQKISWRSVIEYATHCFWVNLYNRKCSGKRFLKFFWQLCSCVKFVYSGNTIPVIPFKVCALCPCGPIKIFFYSDLAWCGKNVGKIL